MQKLTAFTLAMVFSLCAFSQGLTITGKVTDTSENKALSKAVVALMRARDSVLVKFTRTNESGKFTIKAPANGQYILMASYPGYADYADIIIIDKDVDLGELPMVTRAVLLQDVIVRGSAIRMKGDTLAFMADSFKMREGANVEDLLKHLPGLSVNSKGEITAQGERVQKVLVDGDEFFGDDPTLATRNLQAHAVKEVQVFDKKSDQATFTGVDDGQNQKTINLKLKDEYKKGYFGKVNAAGGLPNRWQNQAMINAFKDKRKFSVYGIMSNTNNNGLGWNEESQFGGNINTQTEIGDDGSIMMWSSGDEFGGTGGFYGEGLPTSISAGTSYANKWNENRSNATAAYRYQHLKTEANTTNTTQYILPDTQYFNNQKGLNQATRWRHKAQGKSEIYIDSMQSLVVTLSGSYGENQLHNQFLSEALTAKGLPVNRSDRTTTSQGTQAQMSSSVLYRLKFKKPKRTFSLSLSQQYNDNQSEGTLLTYNEFYTDGQMLRKDTIDQLKNTTNTTNTLSSRMAYSEPIGKNGILEVNYSYNTNRNDQERLSYDKVDGKYDELNMIYSNDFIFHNNTHRTGAGYRYNFKNWNYGLGGEVGFTEWNQEDVFRDTTRRYNFTNFFPRANISYKLGQYSRVRFNYSGNTQAPTLNQLQPVADNTDPLNIFVGNPNLKQSFNHRFEVGYNFYQVLSSKGLWTNISFSPTSNAFSTFDLIDSLGRRINRTVNVNGNFNSSIYAGYNFKLKKSGIQVDLNFNPSLSRVTNYVNGQENLTKNQNWRFGFNANKYKEKKYYFGLYQSFSYNVGKSSIRPDVVTQYWTSETSLDLNYDLPKDFSIGTHLEYNWRQQTDVFTNNNNALMWNATIQKKIIKKKDVQLGFRVNDILNQNIGFRRNVNANYISERTYDVIQRYWLVTLNWTFNKGPQKADEGW